MAAEDELGEEMRLEYNRRVQRMLMEQELGAGGGGDGDTHNEEDAGAAARGAARGREAPATDRGAGALAGTW